MAQPVVQTSVPVAENIAQTVSENISQVVSQSINQAAESSVNFALYVPLIIAIGLLLVFVYALLGRKKSGNQNVIALIGQRYSGKTQLFITMSSGKRFQTVPSIKNNSTTYKMPSSRKTYQFTDYCGDNISKQQVVNPQNYQNIHTIIQVVDGLNPTKLGDAALFMYRLLVSKSYQKRQCNYIVFLNKNDQQNFLTEAKIVKRLQDEIQHIKQSRKNSAQQSQEQQDYLKATKQRFDISKSGIKIVVGAAKNGDIKNLEKILEQIL